MPSGGAATSSGLLAVSAGAKVLPTANGTSNLVTGLLCGVSLITGSATSVLTIYDNNAGNTTGTALESITMPANQSFIIDYAFGTVFNNGLSYVLTGTGAQAIVRYVLGG